MSKAESNTSTLIVSFKSILEGTFNAQNNYIRSWSFDAIDFFFASRFQISRAVRATLEWAGDRAGAAICWRLAVPAEEKPSRKVLNRWRHKRRVSGEGVDGTVEERVEKCPITLIYRATWTMVNRRARVDRRGER